MKISRDTDVRSRIDRSGEVYHPVPQVGFIPELANRYTQSQSERIPFCVWMAHVWAMGESDLPISTGGNGYRGGVHSVHIADLS